jgi:AcrR family transcriptional regulator
MSTSRRSYHHGDLPQALVRAAGRILDKQGLAALTLREVARKAGVSHGAPYRHFPSLEHLLAAVAQQGFSELGEALRSHPAAHMGEAYVKFGLEHPARFRLMFGAVLPLATHPGLRETSRAVYASLVEALRVQGQTAQPEHAAAAAWALVHGLTYLLLDGHLEQLVSSVGRDRVVRTVLGAVRFAAAPQRSA